MREARGVFVVGPQFGEAVLPAEVAHQPPTSIGVTSGELM
jgi:hypothetical protein